MFELIELHHAKPRHEPDADHHRSLTPREFARLNAPRPALAGLLALPLELARWLRPARATSAATHARPRSRTITAKLAP